MTRHLLTLVWNRKRRNLLLVLEIFLSFIVVFVVAILAGTGYYNWRQPLGFDRTDLWTIDVRYPESGPVREDAGADEIAARARAFDTLSRLIAAVDGLPEVERHSTSWPSTPYNRGGWGTGITGTGSTFAAGHVVGDAFRDVYGLRVIAGRWFSREDDATAIQPVVINARLAGELFGSESPLQKTMSLGDEGTMRVVGVIEEFRHEGELGTPENALLVRYSPAAATVAGSLPNLLTVRVRPGTTAAFEETLVETVQAVAPDWSFEVRPVEVSRSRALQARMAPFAVVAILAAFLLVMVALGLTGVVWQNVTQRVQEFGLRRANGATASAVQRQVVSELVLLTSLAIVVGVILVGQVPALPLGRVRMPPTSVWMASIVASAGVIYLVTLLCAWYPSQLATKTHPAEALHYE